MIANVKRSLAHRFADSGLQQSDRLGEMESVHPIRSIASALGIALIIALAFVVGLLLPGSARTPDLNHSRTPAAVTPR